MAYLPKELFDIGAPDKKRVYSFINLDGKEDYVELTFGDRLTNKRCLLDGAHIVSYSGDPHVVEECPVCGKYLSIDKNLSNKSLMEDIVPYTEFRMGKLKEELNHLEAILKLAENSENKIKDANIQNSLYNKANLSAQESKIINMKGYLSKKDLKKFFSLSDHLDPLFSKNSDEKSPSPDESA